ncbi:MAG: PilZ domain-containing protein [Pseudomonadota bacterium]|nr:PilZ domain-containing protein [Pseudomonadota bacterium]
MIKVDLDSLMGGDRRQFHRIAPSVEEPIILKVAGTVFPLIEVSGGGCRLPIAAHLQFSESDFLELCLPGRSAAIMVQLRPVAIDEKAFGAEFVGLDADMREVICTYVRAREIELVRRFRAQGGSTC